MAEKLCGASPAGLYGYSHIPSFVITHRARLQDAPTLYQTFRDKQDDCITVVMKP